jgi:hypothetical protein
VPDVGGIAGERLTTAALLDYFDAHEIWRPVAGWEGYEVSSWGRVKGKRVEILVPARNEGYHTVTLSRGPETTNARVSILVATAFLGPPPFDGAHAAHNDGDKDNNRVRNIRWASALENQADVERHGNRPKGSAVVGARLKEADIPVIRQRALKGERYADIASDFGISISSVSMIKLGRTWRHVPPEERTSDR